MAATAAIGAPTVTAASAPPPVVVTPPVEGAAPAEVTEVEVETDDPNEMSEAQRARKAREILFGGQEEGEAPPEGAEKPPAPPKSGVDAEKPDEDLSPKWARLTAEQRRHKARVQKQTDELNARKAEVDGLQAKLAEREKSIETRDSESKARYDRARKDPLAALEEIGWSLAALTKYVADKGVVPPEKIAQDLKLEYDSELQKTRAEIEAIKKEQAERDETRKRQESEHLAQSYPVKVLNELRQVFHADPAKFPNIASAPEERTHRRVLAFQVAAMNGEHPDFPGEKKYLAVSDALLYAERELAEIYSWRTGQAGTVESGKPGAAKPSQPEATPMSRTERSSRSVVQKKDPDEMDDEERRLEALRILDGEDE